MDQAGVASRMRRCLLLLAILATILVAVPALGAGEVSSAAPDPAQAGVTVGGPHVDAMAPSRSAGRLAKELAPTQGHLDLVPLEPDAVPWPHPALLISVNDFVESPARSAHRAATGDRGPPSQRVDL